MGNIFSPSQPERSASTSSDSKVPANLKAEPKQNGNGSSYSSCPPKEEQAKQDQNNGTSTPSKKLRASTSTRKRSRNQQDHSSQQNSAIASARPATRSASRPRHSGRKRQKPSYLTIQRKDGKKYAESDQAGLNFVKDDDFKVRRDEELQGNEIFSDYLKPAGWRCTTTKGLKSSYVFLAKGATAETAIEGVTKFYSYQEICQKWNSDKDFKEMYYSDDDSEDGSNDNDTMKPKASGGKGRNFKRSSSGTPKRKLKSKRGVNSPKQKSPKRSKTTRSSSKSKK